ncbi:hypothetical protein O9993_01855 [Vibrio lentus]|nr:hypothetical protein [Vibrio lentus]
MIDTYDGKEPMYQVLDQGMETRGEFLLDAWLYFQEQAGFVFLSS